MKRSALLIGVSEYPDGFTALPAAIQDIEALNRVLSNPALGGFEVQLLPNPHYSEMSKEIELWLRNRQPDELALLFFSGHGIKDDRRDLYFAASNTQKINNQLVTSTALSANTLRRFLRFDCRSKQQIVILDCCFAGAFGDSLPRNGGELPLESQLSVEGCVVLTSTSATDYAFETKSSELSVYTRYLVEGLEKGAADANGDGIVTVDELHNFIYRKVKETAPLMEPAIIAIKGQGYHLPMARTPQDTPKQQYRKEVEKRIRKGEITPAAQRILRLLRQRHNLSNKIANEIESEVMKPYRDYQRKLAEYREVLEECIDFAKQQNAGCLTDLRDYRRHLGLESEDTAYIEKSLVGHALIHIDTGVDECEADQQQTKNVLNIDYQTLTSVQRRQHALSVIEQIQCNLAGSIFDRADSISKLSQLVPLSIHLQLIVGLGEVYGQTFSPKQAKEAASIISELSINTGIAELSTLCCGSTLTRDFPPPTLPET